jgi:ribosomal protein S18 acetylase RimI-like enzyme
MAAMVSEAMLASMEGQEKLTALGKISDFVSHLGGGPKYTGGNGKQYILEGMRGTSVPPQEREALVDMVEADLKDHYVDAWGWDRKDKAKELFANVSNFVVAREVGTGDSGEGGEESHGPIVGYVMIRFCWDDDEEPEFPVCYVFELNVAPSERGSGLGRRLMGAATAVQARWGLWKTMLTCFKRNTAAMQFYHKIGFGVDVYSPSRCEGWEPVKYEILSNAPEKKDE